MRGKYGTSMTAFHVRRRPRPLERAKTMCPVCYSLAGELCRKVLSPTGAKNLKLGPGLEKIHPQRRTGKQPAPAANQPPPTLEQRRAAHLEREQRIWGNDKRDRSLGRRS
jgi:hypothetical protein